MTGWQNIKTLRKVKGIKLRELAALSGVSVGYVSELENNKVRADHVSIVVLNKIPGALNVTVDELKGESVTRKYIKDIMCVAEKMDDATRLKYLHMGRVLND